MFVVLVVMGGCSGGVRLGGSRLCGGGFVTDPFRRGEAAAVVVVMWWW